MSNANIHSTAIIHEGAQLHPSVTVGAYSVIGSHVKVGAGTRIGPHCVIEVTPPLVKTIRFFSLLHWVRSRRTRNMRVSLRSW